MYKFATRSLPATALVVFPLAYQLRTVGAAAISTQPNPANAALQGGAESEERAQIPGALAAWEVGCGYAVSDMYCHMQRIRFYTITVFKFCFRFHSWLAASSVGIPPVLSLSSSASHEGRLSGNDGFEHNLLHSRYMQT